MSTSSKTWPWSSKENLTLQQNIQPGDKGFHRFLKHPRLSGIRNKRKLVSPSPVEVVRPEGSSMWKLHRLLWKPTRTELFSKSGQRRTSQPVSDTAVNDVKENLEIMVKPEDHKPSAIQELEAIIVLLKKGKAIKVVGVESQRIERFLKIVEKYMTIVDVAIQYNPDITALVWAGVRFMIQVALNGFQTLENLENSIQKIVTTMSDCEFYERIYATSTLTSSTKILRSKATTENFQITFKPALEQVYAAISIFVDRVKQYFEKPGFIEAFKPFSVEFQPLLDDIINNEQTVRKIADQVSMQGIQEIKQHLVAMDGYRNEMKIVMAAVEKKVHDVQLSITRVENHVVDAKADDAQARVNEKLQKILDDLFNERVDSRHSEVICQRKEGTGKWLLESPEFTDWVRGDSGSALLWAHGIAGAGKTFLSSIVIDHLSNYHSEVSGNNVGVAHIYFSYKEQGSQGLSNILGSLIKQLYQQLPRLPQLPSHLEHLTNDGGTPSREDLFLALVQASKSFFQIFIVFDALDECDRLAQRQTLLPMLRRMGESGFRIFMTSRRYADDIEDSFRNVPCIEIIAHDDDIKSYISERINAYPSAKRMIQAAGLEDEVVSRLVRAAGGMFLFVGLNIRYLCEQPTGRHILMELERLQTAQTTNKPMDRTYDRILEAIRNQPAACATLAIRTLAWLVKSQRILTIKELQIAVSLEADMTKLEKIDMPDEEKLIDICFGLVMMDDVNKTVRLAHFTAQEYLNRMNIIPQNSDTTLAIACTTYLSFDEFKKNACPSCQDYRHRCNRHHFFEYSVANISFHLNSSNQESTVKAFGRFLDHEDNILSYYKALSMLYVWDLMPTQPYHLLVASALGHVVIVDQLLENGCDISIADNRFVTALHLASHNGHLNVVKLLLGKGASPNAVNKKRRSPLHKASQRGHLEVVRLLLDNGADVTLADNDRSTSLYHAAEYGHLNVVKLLLEKGASLSAVDKRRRSPLHKASQRGHLEVVRLLLHNGADVTFADNDMSTPLHHAAEYGHLNVVKLLLEKGASLTAVDLERRSPLHKASQRGRAEVVGLLLNSGANVSVVNKFGSTPLHDAAEFGRLNVVKLLLEKGASLSAVDIERRSPLHKASQHGRAEVVRLLLNNGADVTLADNDMSTPLHHAAEFGNLDVVKLLLEMGASPNAVNSMNDTPFDRAEENGQVIAVELIREWSQLKCSQ